MRNHSLHSSSLEAKRKALNTTPILQQILTFSSWEFINKFDKANTLIYTRRQPNFNPFHLAPHINKTLSSKYELRTNAPRLVLPR